MLYAVFFSFFPRWRLSVGLLNGLLTYLLTDFSYTESCITEIATLLPSATIILAGDFNQLSDDDVVQCTGLISIVPQPTRAASHLDRIYVTCPVYQTVRVVKSLVHSDHNAVVAYTDRPQAPKIVAQKTYRCISPSQHASFLQYYISNLNFTCFKIGRASCRERV